MTNEERRAIVNRATSLGYQGDYVELFKAYAQGQDPLGELELQMQRQANMPMQVANTPQEQSQGLIPFHQAGQTGQSMAFPDVQPHQPFTTKGLTAPIDMTKIDSKGNVVESYKSVQPGIANIPTGPYEGTMIETPATTYLKGGVIKKYQLAGANTPTEDTEEEEVPINESVGRYGKNKGSIQTVEQVNASKEIPEELLTKLEAAQNEINSRDKRVEYEKNVLEAVDRLSKINLNIAKTNYMPESVKQAAIDQGDVPYYCISGVCYTLLEAGENLKYYSNSQLQEDIQNEKLEDWKLNFDTADIKGGDIVQFTGKRGRPHHAALVIPNSIRKQEDGTILFDAYMNSGGGEMYIQKNYKLDPKEDKVKTKLGQSETIQLITKDFDSELITNRDNIKKQIEEINPYYFQPATKSIRYNTYAPDQIEEVALSSAFENRDLSSLSRVGGGDALDKVGKAIGKNMSYEEFVEKAKIRPILNQINEEDFKKDFMERYNISNEEYNAVALTALGIYGQETAFGFKQHRETENDAARAVGARVENLFRVVRGKERRSTDMEDFSRGLTQLKLRNISKDDRKKYNITSETLDNDPVTAIIGAMIVNAQNLPTLRKVASDGRDEEVTTENYLDYLPYLYNQRGNLLRGDEKNAERAAKKARRGREGDEADKAADKAAEESKVKNPYSHKANNRYVSNVTAFKNLFEVMPATVSPISVAPKKVNRYLETPTFKKGGSKCYTCGGLKAKVAYNKPKYKK